MNSINNFTKEIIKDAKVYLESQKNEEDIVVRISKEDIRKKTGRERIKESIVNEIKENLNKAGCSVESCDSDLCVTIPYKITETKILTLKELKEGNK